MRTYIYSCFGLLLLAACGNNEKPADNHATDTIQPAQVVTFNTRALQRLAVEVGHPQLENISGILVLQGKIDVPPQNTVSLSFPLGGYLKSTHLLPGMHVKKGQVLAVIEDMQFIQLQQDYLTAKERLSLAETEFNRQKELNASKASSDRVFEQAKAEMETQRILVSALARKLEVIGISPLKLSPANISKDVNILSPINGFVSKVNVNIGKYTAPTDMLFELIDPTDVHLALNVFEKDLPLISVGQKVTAYTNNDPGKKYAAEIILINRTLNQDRTAEVHCHLKKYDALLIPGMFMNGEVAVDNKKALTVPEEAVVRWENKYYVFLEKNDTTFEMTAVHPGVLNHGRQQIEGTEIGANARLVLKNAYALLLKIKNAEEEE